MHRVYNKDFYNEQKHSSLSSAEVIVPLILDVFTVSSVVDVGCGVGTWLSVFLKNGISEIQGFDINDLSDEYYFIEKEKIKTGYSFSSDSFELNIRSELLICLEVGEHLPETAADNLVKNLVSTAPVIIFSAAFPGQGGVAHVNEQPHWYWREKFQHYGYFEIDFLRPLIWCDYRVSWWYRQNITSYVRSDYLESNQKVKGLYNRYKELPDPHRLTVVSEWILKKHFSEMNQKIKPLSKLRSLIKRVL